MLQEAAESERGRRVLAIYVVCLGGVRSVSEERLQKWR
jgi:hypothetical protein